MAKEFLEKLSAIVGKPMIDKAISDRFPGVTLECRHFFSGAALYADGRICITLTPVGLAMKLPEASGAKLLKSGKAEPLRYFPKSPVKKGYVLFPDGGRRITKALSNNMIESIEYALTLPKPKPKPNSKKT